jgi:hypothetical protein
MTGKDSTGKDRIGRKDRKERTVTTGQKEKDIQERT